MKKSISVYREVKIQSDAGVEMVTDVNPTIRKTSVQIRVNEGHGQNVNVLVVISVICAAPEILRTSCPIIRRTNVRVSRSKTLTQPS